MKLHLEYLKINNRKRTKTKHNKKLKVNIMIQEYFVPIGVALTFIASIITIYYTRKNIKTTKYIETITSERVKWLEVIRTEVSDLVSNIHFTLKVYQNLMEDKKNNAKSEEELIIDNQTIDYFDIETNKAFANKTHSWSESDFVKKLNLLRLRFNPTEDKKVIEILDYFITFYRKSTYKTESEIPKASEKIYSLISCVQSLLKKEWEKCKTETNK